MMISNTNANAQESKMTTQNNTPKTITYVTLTGGIEAPVVNLGTDDKPKPYILPLMLAEMIGLDKSSVIRRIDRMEDVKRCVVVTTVHVPYGTKGAMRAMEMSCLPLRKFEVLINTIDTARIGHTLTPKARAALVSKIETIQEEIRSVIEAYYHDGVVINKKVKTKAGTNKVLEHIENNFDEEELKSVRAILDRTVRNFKTAATDTMTFAEERVAYAEERAQKDKRTSFALRLRDIVVAFEEGTSYFSDGKYKEAVTAFLDAIILVDKAFQASYRYKDTSLDGLRKDMKILKKKVAHLEESMRRFEKEQRRATEAILKAIEKK